MNIEAVCNSWRAMGGRLPARARQVLAVRALHRQVHAAARRSAPSYFEHVSYNAARAARGPHALALAGVLQRDFGADPYSDARGAV